MSSRRASRSRRRQVCRFCVRGGNAVDARSQPRTHSRSSSRPATESGPIFSLLFGSRNRDRCTAKMHRADPPLHGRRNYSRHSAKCPMRVDVSDDTRRRERLGRAVVKFGQLPFERLFEQRHSLCGCDGFLVSPVTANAWQAGLRCAFAGFSRLGDSARSGARRRGDRFASPDQARTLEKSPAPKANRFIAANSRRNCAMPAMRGGYLDGDDLASHHADWVGTISESYYVHDLHEIPPIPPRGSPHCSHWNLWRIRYSSSHAVDRADAWHLQLQAMKPRGGCE